ncbi:MAG: hypothetical protein ABL993_06750 [Vicinamibacterales bacterium]
MFGDYVVSYRAMVPVWLVSVGVAAMWSPPPTVAMGVLMLVITVVVIPALMVTADISRRPRVALASANAVTPTDRAAAKRGEPGT